MTQARDLSARSGVIVALLRQVPFQPIFGGLVEDQAISYTLNKYFETGSKEWPLLLPMVKSVVRAMDVAQTEGARLFGVKLDKFVVTGASKRGWTTWLTAAADPRVAGAVPMVFDILNMRPQLRLQLVSWGQYSEEISDYSGKGLPKALETREGGKLLEIIDPYTFRDDIKAPKLVVLATNDRYWPTDAERLYFDALPDPKYRLHLANEGHDIKDMTPVEEDRAAMALAAAGVIKLPQVTGSLKARPDGGVTLVLKSDGTPSRVRLWRTTSQTRDFRTARWTPEEGGGMTAEIAVPASGPGVAAGFLEARFDLDGHPFTVTGPVGIVER
jgi:PhoPQ-activated pathogenicity-related protein